MIKCRWKKIRPKGGVKFFFCSAKREQITTCEGCELFEIKETKPLKKVSNHREFVSKETYNSVFSRDKGKCVLCGSTVGLELHHINGRSKLKTNDINNCVMLCHNCHHNVVHKENAKYRKILNEMIRGK